MLPTIIIIALIAAWAAFVIIRRVKRVKCGIYCDCGCGSCNCCKGKPKSKNKKEE